MVQFFSTIVETGPAESAYCHEMQGVHVQTTVWTEYEDGRCHRNFIFPLSCLVFTSQSLMSSISTRPVMPLSRMTSAKMPTTATTDPRTTTIVNKSMGYSGCGLERTFLRMIIAKPISMTIPWQMRAKARRII
jgi:hypothetical protein